MPAHDDEDREAAPVLPYLPVADHAPRGVAGVVRVAPHMPRLRRHVGRRGAASTAVRAEMAGAEHRAGEKAMAGEGGMISTLVAVTLGAALFAVVLSWALSIVYAVLAAARWESKGEWDR